MRGADRWAEVQPWGLGWWWVKFCAEWAPLCCYLLQFLLFLGRIRGAEFWCVCLQLCDNILWFLFGGPTLDFRGRTLYTLNFSGPCDESLAAVLALPYRGQLWFTLTVALEVPFLIHWTQTSVWQLKCFMYLHLHYFISENDDCIDNKLYLSQLEIETFDLMGLLSHSLSLDISINSLLVFTFKTCFHSPV